MAYADVYETQSQRGLFAGGGGESQAQQGLLLHFVSFCRAGCGAGACGAFYRADTASLSPARCAAVAASRTNTAPCWPALPAPRRFRARSDALTIASASSRRGNGYKLIEREDRGARVFALAPFGTQIVADFAAGDQNALRVLNLVVGDERQKLWPRKFGEIRTRIRMAQHALRREDDQRLAPRALRLPAQHMEIVAPRSTAGK